MVARIATRLFASCAIAALPIAMPAHADSVGDVRNGNAAFGEGRYDAAIEAFTQAILAGDLSPEALAITFNNRGVAYSEVGDYDRAIQDYGQALTLTPGDPTAIKNLRIAHIRRGGAEARLGEPDKALADYTRAIELDPGHPLAYMRRGQLELDRGDAAAAQPDLARAQELDPANGDIAALLTEAQRALTAAATPQAAPPAATPAPPPAAAPAPPPSDGSRRADTPAATVPPPVTAAEEPPAVADEAPKVEPAAGPSSLQTMPPSRYRVIADVNVRQGPSNDSPRVSGLTSGTEVEVDADSLGWLRLRLADGSYGFVYKKWLEPIARQP